MVMIRPLEQCLMGYREIVYTLKPHFESNSSVL